MIATLDRAELREVARAHFGLEPDLPTLLVTGGSQGARRLNQSVAAAAPAFAAAGVQVLHVVGPTGEVDVPAKQGPAGPPYVVETYVDRMDLAYAAADAVLCRAGANTVTEVSGVGLPAIYVPLPIGNGEQALNARPVVDAGGGLLVADADLDPGLGARARARAAHRPARLAGMARAAAGVIPLDADEKLADMIVERRPGRRRPMRVPVPDVLLPAEALGRVHFVGIGGAGLSGIARIMLARGIEVSGSDAKESARARGAARARCHLLRRARRRAGRGADTLVVSTAVRDDNPEVVEARRLGLRLLPRSAALESVMQGRRVVAVAGTHGKTTTTSMLTVALQHCGADPSFAIGGELNESGSNAHDGTGDLFVAEADESDGAFLVYSPHVALVTNVEADHLDNYGTEEAYRAAFDEFLDRIDPDGFLVACIDDRAPPTWPRRPGRAACAWSRWGSPRPPTCARSTLRFAGATSTFTVVDRGPPARRGAAADPRPALRARRAGGPGRRAPPRLRVRRPGPRARLLQRHPAPDGAQGRGRRHPGLRQLRPPPEGDRRRPPGRPFARGGRAGRRRLPAAHGLAHPDLRRGDGPRARCRRRGRGDGHLRRPRGPRARRQRGAGRRRRTAAAEHVVFEPRWAEHRRPPGRARARPGDVVLTLGAGDVTLLAPEVLAQLTEHSRKNGR